MNGIITFIRWYRYIRVYVITTLGKHSSGLTLIEVVLALLVVSISTVTLLSLQGTLSRGVFSAHTMVSRLAYVKNVFIKADRDKLYESEKNYEQKREDTSMTFVYSAQDISKKPEFKHFPHMVVERVETEWKGLFGKPRKEIMIALRFKPKAQAS